jgi:hypothetical protein
MVPGTLHGRPETQAESQLSMAGYEGDFHSRYTNDVAVLPLHHVMSSTAIGMPIHIGNFIKLDDLTMQKEFASDVDLCDQVGNPTTQRTDPAHFASPNDWQQ